MSAEARRPRCRECRGTGGRHAWDCLASPDFIEEQTRAIVVVRPSSDPVAYSRGVYEGSFEDGEIDGEC